MTTATIIPFPANEEIHISASAVNTLHECMREYYFRYVQGLPREQTSEPMVLGKAIHEALSYFYLVLKQDRELVPLEVLKEMTSAHLEKHDLTEHSEEAHRVLDVFYADGLRPEPETILAVEQKFSIPLLDANTGEILTHVVGFFDLVTANPDGSITVTDHKIVARNDKAKAESPDLQMALYSWAARQVFNAEVIHLQYQDVIKTKTPKLDIKPITRTDPIAEEHAALETIRSANALIGLLVDQSNVEQLMFPKRSWRCAGCGYRERWGG